jgi:hypothetical protein
MLMNILRCGQQLEKIISVVGTTRKNIHELKQEQFTVLLPTTRKNDWRCRQHREHFSSLWATKKFCVVGNNAEELPQSRTV